MSDRVYFKVPYHQKDDAKSLGARWDRANKSWWFPRDKVTPEVTHKWKRNILDEATPATTSIPKKTIVVSNPREYITDDHTLNAWFDGGSRGNPGICGYGSILRGTDGRVLGVDMGGWHIGTNNEAEHMGCVHALRLILKDLRKRFASDEDISELRVSLKGDSKLVIGHATGDYECKSAHLMKYVEEEHKLIEDIKELIDNRISITHVMREKNSDADRLANICMDNM